MSALSASTRRSKALASALVSVVFAMILLAAAGVHAGPMTAQQAAQAVASWRRLDYQPLGAAMSATIAGVTPYTDAAGTVNYYVVSLAPEGYVIVSADDLIEPIIAFSPSGAYEPDPANPMHALVTRDLGGRMAKARAFSAQPEIEASLTGSGTAQSKWSRLLAEYGRMSVTGMGDISDARVEPLVQSKWSQLTNCSKACYNYYTPPLVEGRVYNYPCGCVATTMAQHMRFFQHPTAGIGVHAFEIKINGTPQNRNTRGGDGSGGPYVWSNMILDPDCSSTQTQHAQIGALCADAGVAIGTAYAANGSGIEDLERVVSALKNTFGYSNAVLSYSDDNQLPEDAISNALNANLNAGLPCELGIIGSYSAHIMICDGYGYDASTLYHHLNMGWAGAQDAWYNLPNVDSSPSYSTVAAIIYNTYVTGTGEIISGRVTDSANSPIAGATVTGGSLVDTTDSHGIYGLVHAGSNTSYTVTVSKEGYAFVPRTVTTGQSLSSSTQVGNLWNIDFQAGPNQVVTSASSVSVTEGGTATFGAKLNARPASSVTVTVSRYSGDTDITVQSGASLTFTTSNWNTYQPVTLAAAQDVDALDDTAVIRCSATGGFLSADVTATENDDDKAISTSTTAVTVDEGCTATFGVKLGTQPASSVTINVSRYSGDADISVVEGASLAFTTANWNTYQPVRLLAARDVDYLDGSATIRCSGTGYPARDITASERDLGSTPDTQPPGVPTGLAGTAMSQTWVDLTWNASTDNTAVSGYKVYRGGNLIGTSWSTSYSDKTCASNTAYVYQVSAYDGTGNESAQCSGVSVTTQPYIELILDEESASYTGSWSTSTCNPPDAYNGDYRWTMSAGSDSATAAWRPSIPRAGNWEVYVYYRSGSNRSVRAPYTVYYNGGSQSWQVDQTTGGSQWHYLSTNYFQAGTSGYVKLANGTGEISKVLVADAVKFWFVGGPPLPPDSQPPSVPTNLQGAAASCLQVDLSWTASTDNVAVQGYKIFRNSSQIGTSSAADYSDTTCAASTTYSYAVSAYDGSGNESSQCSPISVTTPSEGPETIVDEDQATLSGSWTYASCNPPEAYNGDYEYVTSRTSETSWAKWTPNLPRMGIYDVYVYYRYGTNRTTKAPYTVYYSGGSQTIQIDQTKNGGQWIYLATQQFDAGISGYVKLSNATGETSKAVVADAVRFYYAQSAPDIVVDDLDPQASSTGSWLSGTAAGGWPASDSEYKWASTHPSPDCTFTWRPNLAAGNYDVYVYYLAGGNRYTDANFTVYYSGGSQNVLVDQTANGSQWYKIASDKLFAAGTSGYVLLQNNASVTGKVVVADAVRFHLTNILNPPVAPTDAAPVANSASSITWRWADVSSETGYRVKDTAGVNKSGDLPTNSIQWVENSLTANMQYTRKIFAFNTSGESPGSTGQSKYTLAKAGESTDGTGNTGNVYCTSASKNTWYGPSKTFTFSNPAGFGTGGTWKASKFEYKWDQVTTEGWAVPGTTWSSGTISLTANQGDGDYYLHVRAFNGESAPNGADVVNYGPFRCDVTAPSVVTVTDEGTYTPSQDTLKASWTASTDESSGIKRYEYAVGTSAITQDKRGWTSNGISTAVTATGLTLIDGTKYYVQARAVDNVDNTGTGSAADGITVAPGVSPIASAWAKANTTDPLSLRNKVVTAAIPGAFWLEETDRTMGIRVVSSVSVARGNSVSVAGVLGTSGVQRALIGDVVINAGGTTTIEPAAMPQKSLGGGSFNALTPGITDGKGLYNVGLLVRVWGNVTYSNTTDPFDKYFYIDDGSGLLRQGNVGVLVRCGSVAPPSSGMVIVTGVVGMELCESSWKAPVILIRDGSDILTL